MERQKKEGFTLIELLVVIAIIGILAGMVLVSMQGARAKARDARRMADLRQMVSAQEMYYGDHDSYLESATMPTAIDTYLNPMPEDPGGFSAVVACTDAAPQGVYCTYDNTGEGQKFCYYARLEQNATTPYFTASHAGNFKRLTAPSDIDECATSEEIP